MRTDAITFWVIYDHPKDYPNGFIGRRQYTGADGIVFDEQPFGEGPTLESVRARVPAGCHLFPRNERDDPAIAETWMQ